MDWLANLLLLFGIVAVLMLLGLPVALAFMAANVAGAFLFMGGLVGIDQLARNTVASLITFSLTPIPLFILMGEILFQTGLAIRLIDAIDRLISWVPGRLPVVAVVAGTAFSAVSGSTIATTAMLGRSMTPIMLEKKYHPSLAMGPIIAIGGVDMLIPPSALIVLFGSLAGISITKLLFAGIVPGLLLAVAFVGYIIIRAIISPHMTPGTEGPGRYKGWARYGPFCTYVMPMLSIFVVVIGSMVGGLATPTESAAVGAAFTVLLAAMYRKLTRANFIASLEGVYKIKWPTDAAVFLLRPAIPKLRRLG